MISCCSKFVCFRSLGVFVLFGGSPDFQKFRSRAADDTHKCQADFCLGAHAGMIVLSVQSCVIRPISRRSVRRASIFSKCFLCRSGHACELGAHPEDTVEALSSRSPAHLSLAKRAEDEKLIRLLESWPCVGGPSEGGVAQAMSRDCPHGAWTRSRPPHTVPESPPHHVYPRRGPVLRAAACTGAAEAARGVREVLQGGPAEPEGWPHRAGPPHPSARLLTLGIFGFVCMCGGPRLVMGPRSLVAER